LVNNAGVFPFGPTHEASEADFDSAFAVNVKAPFFLWPGRSAGCPRQDPDARGEFGEP
jgi:NAD(P)-dependent dehydrogenase (short-subunit alcohol dehydrogenase family)